MSLDLELGRGTALYTELTVLWTESAEHDLVRARFKTSISRTVGPSAFMSSRFNNDFVSWRAQWRAVTNKTAIEDNDWPLFRLRSTPQTQTTFEAEYSWSKLQPFLAISHSWTDRTGPGDAIIINDLAPWPICVAPSKIGFLAFLWQLQIQAAADDNVELWFWLDLLCIDQSREDPASFSRQLQQIPLIFSKADGTIVQIVSKPCSVAQASPSPSSSSDVDGEWHALKAWLKTHHLHCSCTPMMDAWLTRVWTRQELRYSNNVWLVPVNTWAASSTDLNEALWNARPSFFSNGCVEDGVDEFASCLVTWAEKNRRALSSAEIARIAVDLIHGREVALAVDSLRTTASKRSSLQEWFAFNWAMILNGSIRRTTKARDAIISQMLLLPGYRVPELTPLTTLQQIADDARMQFRYLISQYQLVPKDLRPEVRMTSGFRPACRTHGIAVQPKLADVLALVGSPAKLQQQSDLHDLVLGNEDRDSKSSLVVYQSPRRPVLRLLSTLDLVQAPRLAVRYFLDLRGFWSTHARCSTETGVWRLLRAFSRQYEHAELNAVDTIELSRKLHRIACCILRGGPVESDSPNGSSLGPNNEDWDRSVPFCDSSCTLPALHAVQISYGSTDLSHVNLLFGDVSESKDAGIFILGLDKCILREIGIIGTSNASRVELRASGVMLACV